MGFSLYRIQQNIQRCTQQSLNVGFSEYDLRCRPMFRLGSWEVIGRKSKRKARISLVLEYHDSTNETEEWRNLCLGMSGQTFSFLYCNLTPRSSWNRNIKGYSRYPRFPTHLQALHMTCKLDHRPTVSSDHPHLCICSTPGKFHISFPTLDIEDWKGPSDHLERGYFPDQWN